MGPGLLLTEVHSGGGAFSPAGAATGDRSFRPHHHTRNNDAQNQQTLKCPRCDSLNTKFCYYNNYNLSQPRHFCRSCRRYWTKGGVLRNVPVGGGCRKSKSSKPKNSTSAAARTAPQPGSSSPQPEHERKTSNSHTGSENSTLTAVATNVITEAVSAPSSNSTSDNLFDNLQDSDLFLHSSSKPGSEAGVTEQGVDSGFFSQIESLTSLIMPTNEALPFGYGNMREASSFQLCSQWQKGMNTRYRHHQDSKWPETTTTGSSMEVVDWRGGRDEQGLFDVGDTVEEGLWGQGQWNGDNTSPFHYPER